MGSTALMACLMTSPIALFVLILIIKQEPRCEEDYQEPPTQKEDEPRRTASSRETQSAPNVIAIEDIRALAGIAEHPSMKRLKT